MAQLFSFGELIEVGTGLMIVVFAVLGMTHDWTPDEDGPAVTRRTHRDPSPEDHA